MIKNYQSDVPYNFKYDLFSNKLSFGDKKNQYILVAFEFDYFAIFLYRALYLREINLV